MLHKGDEPPLAVEKPRFGGGGLAAHVEHGPDRAQRGGVPT